MYSFVEANTQGFSASIPDTTFDSSYQDHTLESTIRSDVSASVVESLADLTFADDDDDDDRILDPTLSSHLPDYACAYCGGALSYVGVGLLQFYIVARWACRHCICDFVI